MNKLTSRQGQIAKLLVTGKSTKQIAYELGISMGTVKVHINQIYSRLGVHSRMMLFVQWREEL